MDYKYNEQQTKRNYKPFFFKKKNLFTILTHKMRLKSACVIGQMYDLSAASRKKQNQKQTNKKQAMRGHLNAFLLVVVFTGAPVRMLIAIKTLHAWM